MAYHSVPNACEHLMRGPFTWRRAFFSRRSVLANVVRKYLHNRDKYTRQLAATAELGVQVLRFRTPRQTRKWLNGNVVTSLGQNSRRSHLRFCWAYESPRLASPCNMTRFSTRSARGLWKHCLSRCLLRMTELPSPPDRTGDQHECAGSPLGERRAHRKGPVDG